MSGTTAPLDLPGLQLFGQMTQNPRMMENPLGGPPLPDPNNTANMPQSTQAPWPRPAPVLTWHQQQVLAHIHALIRAAQPPQLSDSGLAGAYNRLPFNQGQPIPPAGQLSAEPIPFMGSMSPPSAGAVGPLPQETLPPSVIGPQMPPRAPLRGT